MHPVPSVDMLPRRECAYPRIEEENLADHSMSLTCINGDAIRVSDDSAHYSLPGWYLCAKYTLAEMTSPTNKLRKVTETRAVFFPRKDVEDGNYAASKDFCVVHHNWPFGYSWVGKIQSIYDAAKGFNDVDKIVWHGRGIQFPVGADTIYEGNWNNGKECGRGRLHLLDAEGTIVEYTHNAEGKRVELSRSPGHKFPTFAGMPLILRLIMVSETRKTIGGDAVWEARCHADEVSKIRRIEALSSTKRQEELEWMEAREKGWYSGAPKVFDKEYLDSFPKANVDWDAVYSKKYDPTPRTMKISKPRAPEDVFAKWGDEMITTFVFPSAAKKRDVDVFAELMTSEKKEKANKKNKAMMLERKKKAALENQRKVIEENMEKAKKKKKKKAKKPQDPVVVVAPQEEATVPQIETTQECLADPQIIPVALSPSCPDALVDVEKPADNSTQECPICFDKKMDTTFACGHVLCHDCAKLVKDCPICRAPVTQRIRIFI